jgi:AraC family transcriptional regulator, positive regulator of tynA and feaB
VEILFRYHGADLTESQRRLDATVRSEFADGILCIRPGQHPVSLCLERGPTDSVTYAWSEHNVDIEFRRSWQHIRNRRAHVSLVHFVFQGELQVSVPGASYLVKPGNCAIINVDEPFISRAVVGRKGFFEAAYAALPEHLALTHLLRAMTLQAPLKLEPSQQAVFEKILELIRLKSTQPGSEIGRLLSDAFLEALSDSFAGLEIGAAESDTVTDRRFNDIQSYIGKCFTSTDLSVPHVARACGISPRYLAFVLKARQTTYSELLWGHRLARAKEWLCMRAFHRYPIRRVAKMSGFKTAAHFSRVFKVAYGNSPGEYRRLNQSVTQHAAPGHRQLSTPRTRRGLCDRHTPRQRRRN